MTLTLTGNIKDITSKPVDALTQVMVKAPAPTIGAGSSIVTTAPRKVDVGADGAFSFQVEPGKGWLYLEAEGWSDSIPFIAAEGMSLFIEAWANATGDAGVYALIKDLIDALGESTENTLQGLVDLAKTYAEAAGRAAAAESVYYKGRIDSAVDILTLTPGRYTINDAAVAQAMGLPGGVRGELRVMYIDGPNGRLYGRFYWDVDPTTGYESWRAISYNGKLLSWSQVNAGYVKRALTESDVLGQLEPGRYAVTSQSVATALGLPNPSLGRGIVVIDYLGPSAYQRIHWWGGVYPVEHWTAYFFNKKVAGTGWEKLYPLETTNGAKTEIELTAAGELLSAMIVTNDPTLDYEAKHAELVSGMTDTIGDTAVGDKAAIALVYDHGTTAFRDWIWPELKKRGLPATLALSPEVHLDGKGDSRHQATNEEIAAWVKDGLDIASHSGDHEGAVGAAAIWRQIVSSKAALESKLGTKVWSWVQPGYALSDGSYDGFGTGQSAENYTGTFAGRLLQKTYAVITGYVGDDYVYPMAPLPVGVQRSQIEEAGTVETVKAYIEETIAQKGKHITFVHPYALGNSGMVTKEEYLAFLDWLVGKRDAGEIEVLTLPKLAIAHQYKSNF